MLPITEKAKYSSLLIHDCGLADYKQVLEQQWRLREERRGGKAANTVLIVEHPPVITLGARESANKLLANQNDLAKRKINVVSVRRGGGATAHNPGQLVFYPILHLGYLGLGVSDYIRQLEAVGIELLQQLGVKSRRRKGFPGLWVGDKKIASIGVRASKSVTYHGMAINIQNDLSIFDYIEPCGLDGVEMTSVLKETAQRHSMNEVKKRLSRLLARHFSHTVRPSQANRRSGLNLPPWLRRPLPATRTYERTESVLTSLRIQTICMNANCPNRGECWKRGTATALILGNICTRKCGFCSVARGKPQPPDTTEPARLAEMARQLDLKYLVVTSVNRDDLPDGGASHFCGCINEVRRLCPNTRFEMLTPDFRGCQGRAIEILRDALPFVFAHNIETVPSLYPIARAGGDYQRSLDLLRMAKEEYANVQTKSSIMLGLGETDEEVHKVLQDLRNVGCDRITIGQYLKSSKNCLAVAEFVTPEKFDRWEQNAIELGFSWAMSSPFARSSYFAEQEEAP
jgi:lipoic acid synthetase